MMSVSCELDLYIFKCCSFELHVKAYKLGLTMKSKIYDLYKFNLWFLFARRNCELQNKQKLNVYSTETLVLAN